MKRHRIVKQKNPVSLSQIIEMSEPVSTESPYFMLKNVYFKDCSFKEPMCFFLHEGFKIDECVFKLGTTILVDYRDEFLLGGFIRCKNVVFKGCDMAYTTLAGFDKALTPLRMEYPNLPYMKASS